MESRVSCVLGTPSATKPHPHFHVALVFCEAGSYSIAEVDLRVGISFSPPWVPPHPAHYELMLNDLTFSLVFLFCDVECEPKASCAVSKCSTTGHTLAFSLLMSFLDEQLLSLRFSCCLYDEPVISHAACFLLGRWWLGRGGYGVLRQSCYVDLAGLPSTLCGPGWL